MRLIRPGRDDPSVGYKLGLTSRPMQEVLGACQRTPGELASDDAGGLGVALDALQAEGVIVEWRRFPAIGLFFLQVATERAAVSSIFTAAQVEAFVFGSRAGLRAGRSASAAWNDQEAPAG